MKIEQSGEPVGEVVSLDLVKPHCRVRHADDDALIEQYIAAAVEWVQDACHTVLLETEFRAQGKSFDLSFEGYPNPVVASVSYLDPLGVPGTITEFDIRDNALFIENAPQISSATVNFTAGLGAGNIPAKLAQASLMLAASFYLQRADTTTDTANSVPMGVRAMVFHHRSFAF